MKNIWLEVDEPRRSFFRIAHKMLASIAFCARTGKVSELYALYGSFVKAYKKLDTVLRLYDSNVITVCNGIDAALAIYFPSDTRFDEIFAS